MGENLCISSYIRKPFLIYDFATAPLWISLYIYKIRFSFYQSQKVHAHLQSCTFLEVSPDTIFLNFKATRNRFQGIDSSSLCGLVRQLYSYSVPSSHRWRKSPGETRRRVCEYIEAKPSATKPLPGSGSSINSAGIHRRSDRTVFQPFHQIAHLLLCLSLQIYLERFIRIPLYQFQCCGSGSVVSACFCASRIRIRIQWSEPEVRIRIRILPFSYKCVARTEIMSAK